MKSLPAFKYLIEERKLTEETIRTFHLAASDPRGLVYVDADMPENFPKLDFRFSNASLFPIFDLYNKLVGVSARPLVAKPDMPKYVNTEYRKSEHLYGLNVTWKDLVRERVVYVVEGNIDVLQMHQKGIKNVVGLLSGNFSSDQFALLAGFVEKVVFVLDGDLAGIEFMENLRPVLAKRYKDVNVNTVFKILPFDGKTKIDPDSYLLNHTKEEFLSLPEVEVKK